jgi:hypothetical protein
MSCPYRDRSELLKGIRDVQQRFWSKQLFGAIWRVASPFERLLNLLGLVHGAHLCGELPYLGEKHGRKNGFLE